LTIYFDKDIKEESGGVMNLKLALLPLMMATFSSCTITISQTATDTHGWANDVVDETQKSDASADVETDFTATVPASAMAI